MVQHVLRRSRYVANDEEALWTACRDQHQILPAHFADVGGGHIVGGGPDGKPKFEFAR